MKKKVNMIWHDYKFIDFYVVIEISHFLQLSKYNLSILGIMNSRTVREAGPYDFAQKFLLVSCADGYEIISWQIVVIAFQSNPFSFHWRPRIKKGR